jgi:hypothetical protein
MLARLELLRTVMSQPKPARPLRRLAVYAFAVALAFGATAQATAVEASPREKRTDLAGDSGATIHGNDGPSSIWSSAGHEPDANPSFFQSWLATLFIRLTSLKSAVQQALTNAWKLGHTKPDNTCS